MLKVLLNFKEILLCFCDFIYRLIDNTSVKMWKYIVIILLSCEIIHIYAERWSRQVPQTGFLAHQINDWIPLSSQQHSERSLRLATFPNNQQHFGQSQPLSYNNPFGIASNNKFNFGTTVPQAQRLLQQNTGFGQQTPQQLQSVEPQQNLEQPVELLYVPLETLQKQGFQGNQNRYNLVPQNVNAALINDFYESGTVEPLNKNRFAAPITTTTSAPVTERFSSFQSTSKATHGTLKPYQPPLAMFLLHDGPNKASINDILATLKQASTIDVLDAPSETRPNVFIGPSDLATPPGYNKFELPYLSNLDSARSGRKIESLPFFVAPLSYNSPPGFAKIPLPAPHVGSVVVNSPLEQQRTNNNFFTQTTQGIQSQKFGFSQAEKAQSNFGFGSNFVNQPQSAPTVAPPNRFNSNFFGGTFQTTSRPTSGKSTTRKPSFSSQHLSLNNDGSSNLKEEHFNTQKHRTQSRPLQTFTTFSNNQPTKSKQAHEQYHEEVTATESTVPDTQYYSNDVSTTSKKPSVKGRPTHAQTAQSSISYQTAPSRRPQSQFFEESFQSPSSTPSQNFFSFSQQDPFSDQRFVHKFKLVDSVKPNFEATPEPDFFSFNSNPFGFGNQYSTASPPTPTKQRFNSFPSTTRAPVTQKQTQSSFEFTPSSIKPVNEDSSIEIATSVPISSFTPTSSFLTTDLNEPSRVNVNGQSPANVHLQNLLETQTEYDPYKVPITEKNTSSRGNINNYRQNTNRPTSISFTERPHDYTFQSRRPVTHSSAAPTVNSVPFNRVNHQHSRPTKTQTTSTQQHSSISSSEQYIPQSITYSTSQPNSRPFILDSTVDLRRPHNLVNDYQSTVRPSARPVSETFEIRRPVNQQSVQTSTSRQRPRPINDNLFDEQRPANHAPARTHNRGTRPSSIATEAPFRPSAVPQNVRFQEDNQLFDEDIRNTYHNIPTTTTTTTTIKPITEFSYDVTKIPVPEEHPNVHEVQNEHIMLIQHNSQGVSENVPVNTESSVLVTESHVSHNTPTELPPISPMLPGLINSLSDDKWMDKPKEEITTTTRRPFIRGRKPLPSRNEGSTASQKVIGERNTPSPTAIRTRRPISSTRKNRPESSTTSQSQNVTKEITGVPRTQHQRNPNRVRYNPTPEERQRLRSRGRVTVNQKTGGQDTEKDIDYQRDVLNQNYPIIKPRPTVITTTSTTTETPTKVPSDNFNNIYTQELEEQEKRFSDTFHGLEEEMQTPVEYQTIRNDEDVTETILDQRQKLFNQNKVRVSPVFSTGRPVSRITTTEIPETTTSSDSKKRPTFPRRQPRPYSTVQKPTTPEPDEEITTKRPQSQRNGLKIRARRPVGQTTPEPIEGSSRRSFQSRVNQNDLEKVQLHRRVPVNSDEQDPTFTPNRQADRQQVI